MVVDPNHETASLTMVNSDRLRGAVTLAPLRLQTLFGTVTVDFALISRITVLSGDGHSLPASLTDALVLYYSFDEDGHRTVKDDSGKTAPGKVEGAKWTKKGKSGGAYDFDGQSSRITTPPVDTVGETTWSAWVYPHSLPVQHDTCAQILGAKGHLWAWNSDNTALSFVCGEHFQPSRLAMNFHVQGTPTTAGWATLTFQTRPDLDRWYHVAGVLDSSGIHLYLDAKLVAENSDKTKIPVPSPMIIGCNDNGPQRFFDGLIDEVMIFKKALTAEEIELIRTAQR
jgi:hypothetical protein